MIIRLTFEATIDVEVEGSAENVRNDPEAYVDAIRRARDLVQIEEIAGMLLLVGADLVDEDD